MFRRPLLTDYRQDLRMFPGRGHQLGVLLVLGFALYFPFYAGDHWLSIATSALIAVVGASALMMLTGFAGQISLGHAAFLAVGAYTVAILGARWGVPFWMALPAAGFVAALVGLLIGPFALRLEGLYLAIVTIGLLFLVTHVLLSLPKLTNGFNGMAVGMHAWFPEPGSRSAAFGDFSNESTIWGIRLRFEQKLYLVFLVVAVVTGLVTRNLKRSNTGRAMFAVRDHDLAAAVLGVHPAKTKIVAFGLSSFFAGVAGGMLAYKATYITAPPFDLVMSIDYIAMIVLGGIGTVFGAVAGAVAFVMLHPLAEKLGGQIGLGKFITSTEQQATLIFALVVIGFLIFEPLGLAGIWRRVKRYFQGWPFRY